MKILFTATVKSIQLCLEISMMHALYAELISSQVNQQSGATYDLMTSRDANHVTVTSLTGCNDVDVKSTTCNAEVGVNATSVTSTVHQSTAADFSQHTNNAYV